MRILDANVFAGDSVRRNTYSMECLRRDMRANGICGAVVRPLVPVGHDFRKANRLLAETVRAQKDFIGFARIDPWDPDAVGQVEEAAALGLKGIHLHPWEENFLAYGDPAIEAAKAAGQNNLPVYISAGYPCVSEPLQVMELAHRLPEVRFIASHGAQLDMSGNSFDEVLILAGETDNVWFDFSGVYRRDFMENLIAACGIERVVFGSCMPYMDMAMEIRRVMAVNISEQEKQMIFADNLERLLGGYDA